MNSLASTLKESLKAKTLLALGVTAAFAFVARGLGLPLELALCAGGALTGRALAECLAFSLYHLRVTALRTGASIANTTPPVLSADPPELTPTDSALIQMARFFTHGQEGNLPDIEIKLTRDVDQGSNDQNTLYFNPDFLDSLPPDQMMALVGHEMGHLCQRHWTAHTDETGKTSIVGGDLPLNRTWEDVHRARYDRASVIGAIGGGALPAAVFFPAQPLMNMVTLGAFVLWPLLVKPYTLNVFHHQLAQVLEYDADRFAATRMGSIVPTTSLLMNVHSQILQDHAINKRITSAYLRDCAKAAVTEPALLGSVLKDTFKNLAKKLALSNGPFLRTHPPLEERVSALYRLDLTLDRRPAAQSRRVYDSLSGP